MATSTISDIKKEVRLLRSFVIGLAGRDFEGNYRPKFTQRVLRAAAEKPEYHFYDRISFLEHLRGKKIR